MPVSLWHGLERSIDFLRDQRPWSVLDVGAGFGLWAFLIRQYLDVWEGRLDPDDWLVEIDGIEIVRGRVQPHMRYLYTNIIAGNALVEVPRLLRRKNYDLAIFGDVLEHMHKEKAISLLRLVMAHPGLSVLIRIPIGNGWRRRGRISSDNHLSVWSISDFSFPGCQYQVFDFQQRKYGVFLIASIEPLSPYQHAVSEFAAALRSVENRLQQLVASHHSE